MRTPSRFVPARRRRLLRQGPYQALGFLARGLGEPERFLRGFARVAFVRELVLPRCSRLFRGPRLRLRISELLLPSVSIGPELGCHFTLAAQSFDRFVLCQLRMADLCLQIVRDGLHVR